MKNGRGIQKIISSCDNAHVPEPDFFADALEFKVTFRFPTNLKPPVYNVADEVTLAEEPLAIRQAEIVRILTEGR